MIRSVLTSGGGGLGVRAIVGGALRKCVGKTDTDRGDGLPKKKKMQHMTMFGLWPGEGGRRRAGPLEGNAESIRCYRRISR